VKAFDSSSRKRRNTKKLLTFTFYVVLVSSVQQRNSDIDILFQILFHYKTYIFTLRSWGPKMKIKSKGTKKKEFFFSFLGPHL